MDNRTIEDIRKNETLLINELKQKENIINKTKDVIEQMLTTGYSKGLTYYYPVKNGEFGIRAKVLLEILDNKVIFLNDKVEILEEDKPIIEKINIEQDSPSHFYITNEYGTKCSLTKHSKIIADKLNEVIDYINRRELMK